MGNIIDLGLLVEPKQVRLVEGGPVYKLPPDVPVPLMLYLEHHEGADLTLDVVEDLYGEILALFRVYQPDLESLPIGLVQMITMVRTVYSAEEEAEPDPPPKPAGGTKTSSRKPAAKRSRSSS